MVFSSDGLRIRSADSLHHEIAQGMKLIELEEVYLPVLRSIEGTIMKRELGMPKVSEEYFEKKNIIDKTKTEFALCV